MLNRVLRPFLMEWHPKLRNWERNNSHRDESEWEGRSEFLDALSRAAQVVIPVDVERQIGASLAQAG